MLKLYCLKSNFSLLMNNINIISNILNLNLEKYKIINCNIEKDNILEFHVKWITRYCNCPQCWLKTSKRQDLKEYKQKKNLKHTRCPLRV